jgi:hypothetical protein
MFNQVEKLKYTLENENNNINGTAWELLVKYFECRDNDMIEKLIQINEEKEKKIRDETIFSTRRDRIPKLDFEIDNYDEWFYAIKSSIRRTTFHQYFERNDIIIDKNYENELYDIIDDSISEEIKNKLQLNNINKNPKKLIKEILRVKRNIKNTKIKTLLEYINNHKYRKPDDINRHLDIIFMLFDELSKLKKEFTEKEKLDKILNSLPEDYSNNIKKLLQGSQQLGLGILYIVKYVDLWNKKAASETIKIEQPSTLPSDHSFLSNDNILNNKILLERNFFTESKDISNSDDKKEKQQPKIKVSILPINNASLNYNYKSRNENEEVTINDDINDDNKTLMPESSSNDGGEDNVTEIMERDIPSIDSEEKEKEDNIKMQKYHKLKAIFSIKNLFICFIFVLIIEGLIYLKYDALKKIIPSL